MTRVDDHLRCDVLVIGGGGGGLRAAVAARAAGADTLVVSKGVVGRSGLTQTAVTGFQVALGHADPRDNPGVHEADSLRGSYGLADPALVAVFTAEAASALAAIEQMGARFDRLPDGRYAQRRETSADRRQDLARCHACRCGVGSRSPRA
ncbi:FAD-binding protein [Roseomonas sp. CCTCC AB2023176]|uniref:FAD-binding protein n=1 Tax=Roseomonas sp. CCTCC AB2023176 TaxID=3342640 RepID=UPI0035D530C2